LYTVREFTQTPEDIAKTLKRIREIGYEAVQVSGFGPIDKKELRKILDGEGLKCAATHISFDDMRDDTERVVDEHKILGCDYPAIGGMPGEYRKEKKFAEFAPEMSDVAGRLAEHGLTFGYHNHSFELEKTDDGRTGLQVLMEESDPKTVTFEIDTYWIQHGGGCPATWIKKAAGRIPLLHLKDMAMIEGEQAMAEVGEGNLDWPGILAAADDAGTRWYLIEQDVCRRDPFESLAISLRNVKAMGLS
jgi:sugar phosphate isomerase/epimerase